MIRERSEVDRQYDDFLKKRKRQNVLGTMMASDFQAEYDSIYGTPEAVAEWDRMNSLYRERYERENDR